MQKQESTEYGMGQRLAARPQPSPNVQAKPVEGGARWNNVCCFVCYPKVCLCTSAELEGV